MAGREGSNSLIQAVVFGIFFLGIIVYGTSVIMTGAVVTPRETEVPLLAYLADDEKVAKLVKDMKAGDIPTECDVLYDQMGSNPSVTVTDEDEIREVYGLVTKIVAKPDETAMPATDGYHHVRFTLHDGTKVGWSFCGTGCIELGKRGYLVVTGDGSLWAYVRKLTEEEGRNPITDEGKDGKDMGKDRKTDGTEAETLLEHCSDDEKVAQLVQDMADGKVPTECNVLYDQMGANPDLTVTDPDMISEIYGLVEGIEIDNDTDAMPITDSYHHVWFTLQDGTKVGWSFEGAGCVDRGRDSLAVRGDGELWQYVRQLYASGYDGKDSTTGKDEKKDKGNGKDGGQTADGSYPISIDDEEEVVRSCPKSAKPGDTVTVEIADMTDMYPVVTVDGGDVEARQRGMSFLFVMPDHAVTVEVHTSSEGIGGA